MRREAPIFSFGSIERVTGWSGAHSDEPPSTVRAPTPGTKLKSGQAPDSFTVSEGARMSLSKSKSGPLLKYAAGVEIEIKSSGDGRVAGYGSVFNTLDSYGEKVAPGAFAKSLAGGVLPKMLWQHDTDRPIGRWLKASEDGRGLYVEGQLNLKTTAGQDAYEHLVAGDVDGMSIGYREVRTRNEGQARVLEELALYEVSIVTFPANRDAAVDTIKALNSKSELVDLLRGAGLAKAAAARVAAGGWPALAGADHQKAADLADIIERATAQIRGL